MIDVNSMLDHAVRDAVIEEIDRRLAARTAREDALTDKYGERVSAARAAKLLNHSEQYIRKLVAMGELDGSERGIVVRSIAGYLERIAARGGQTKRLRADRGDCPYYVSAK